MKYKKAFKSPEGRAEVLAVYGTILENWRVSCELSDIDTSYGKTFIIKSGDSRLPPLVLLHGTGSNSAMWLDEVEEFSKHFCVYAIDMPGEPGKSEERQYSLKGSAYLDWLHEALNMLALNNVSIAGISLGAWLAAGFASAYPEMVEKLVLLCPSGIGRQRASFLFKAMPLMLLGDWGLDRLVRMVNGGQSIPKEVVDYTKLIARHFNLRSEPVPIYSDDRLKRLNMPVLLFAGERDVLLDSRETVRRISSLLPDAKVNLLPEYGHVLIGLKHRITAFLLHNDPA